MLTRRELMASGGALVGSLACGTDPTDTGTPLNVLFLFPDQMRGQAMGCMGNPDVKTPNLDKLGPPRVCSSATISPTLPYAVLPGP